MIMYYCSTFKKSPPPDIVYQAIHQYQGSKLRTWPLGCVIKTMFNFGFEGELIKVWMSNVTATLDIVRLQYSGTFGPCEGDIRKTPLISELPNNLLCRQF